MIEDKLMRKMEHLIDHHSVVIRDQNAFLKRLPGQQNLARLNCRATVASVTRASLSRHLG
jgi:hypothetical protein